MLFKVITDPEKIRRKQFRRKLLRWLCVLGMVVMLCWGISPFAKLGLNTTASLDGWLFLIVKNQPLERGGLYALMRPENSFYKKLDFFKIIKGVPGDVVEKKGRAFFINGEPLGVAVEKSMSGQALVAAEGGVIPDQYYFVWTPHERSFDSRYQEIGLIHESHFIGRLYRIF